ncbi:AraC family transcriptional regulator [Parashewanella spongiae]|uniref:AraC family transcriptional regulator n=1 Tax=Parashewanella spongiae TaxID=342950 RepID=A0A3A6UBG1_9GAMM|nr:helix-turn-helix domain-containing protein [Parashewanella spongiae]MCL1076964.1 AraC family transcriptional regulator [Parashewanella spongiae]RJY18920.1 AraC family transcriptional regulator [Parashewanella spongiae]
MSAIQIVLFKEPGVIRYQNEVSNVAANQLVMTSEDAMVSAVSRENWINLFCYSGELHSLYNEVVDLISQEKEVKFFKLDFTKTIPVASQLVKVIEQLSNNKNMMMKFIFIYCLSMDKEYFSKMLIYYLAHNDKVLSYLEEHFMNPWPVTQFAEDLDVDVKKLNFLFYKNYGVSAKKWLLERRLSYARKQLLITSKKIADIALDSGFSNHAHFTDAFKKRYMCCPTVVRATSL